MFPFYHPSTTTIIIMTTDGLPPCALVHPSAGSKIMTTAI